MGLRIVIVLLAAALARPVAAQAPCPSSDISDVMRDPAVQDALDRAWRDSHEGRPDEHEEGGDIYQCRVANGDGSHSYRTEVRPWESGSIDGVSGGDYPTSDSSCRLVATYHTHPGGAGDDGFDNHRPSGEDLLGSGDEGVPGIIRYGHDGDTHDFSYGYNGMTGPRDPSWGCPGDSSPGGSSVGEPHLRSLDGRKFDFQGIGDFVLVRSQKGDLEIHVRQQPFREFKHVSVNGGLVVRDGADRVEWALGRAEPLLNGKPRALASGEKVKLRSHAILRGADGGFVLLTAAGDRISVVLNPNGTYLDLRISLAAHRKGQVAGLLGNYDTDPDNDVQTSDGRMVTPPKSGDTADFTHPMYRAFGESWRVGADRVLFTTPFSSPLDPKTFPARSPRIPDAQLAAAASRCANEGVADDFALAACAFDVAVTGDDAFIASSLRISRAEAANALSPATGGAVAPDREVTGRLTRPDQRVEYTVDLQRGAYIFDARGSTGTWWRLTSPDRKTPFNSNQSAYMGDYPVRLVITQAGRYVIAVGVQPQKPSGSYRFRVRTAPETPPKPLAPGQEVSGRIATIGEEHIYTLPIVAGTYAFEALAADNTSWVLTAPDGRTPFDGNQEEFMNTVSSKTLPSGQYTLKIRGRAIVGVGAYRFRVVRK